MGLSQQVNKYNKFNNAGARILHSIYDMTLIKLFLKLHFWRENAKILLKYDICKPLVVNLFGVYSSCQPKPQLKMWSLNVVCCNGNRFILNLQCQTV